MRERSRLRSVPGMIAVTRPRLVFPTTRRGWLAVGGSTVLLAASMILENATFPTGAVSTAVLLAVAGAVLACVLSYPVPLLGLVAAIGLSVANMVVPGMPHGGGTQLIILMFLVGFLAFRLPGRWSFAAWLVTAVTVGIGSGVAGGGWFEVLFYLLFLVPAWTVGFLLQREKRRSLELAGLAEALAAERELRTQDAITAERARIARELHDAVAHSVSVMTLQVGVVRRRLDALPDEQRTLRQAEQLGRQSVDELRRIVGLVRPDGPSLAPVPSLTQLDDLVAQVRAAGTPVTLERSGPLPDPGSALDVSAYRIVQEGLTNVIRHAPGAAVVVGLDGGPDRLTITVTDDGPRVGEVAAGNGLTGMGERVAMFGGTLRFGPGEPGGFAVTAVLPTTARVRERVR